MGDFFWVFFFVVVGLPLIKQRMLEATRTRLLKKIQDDRGSRVIALVHRQETMSILGIPVFRYIDIEDSERIMRAIDSTDPQCPLDLILHTPGGLVLASTQIARALARHPGKVTVFVPHYAMSGGTLIALAADEIVMTKHAVLGPTDPQIGGNPAASLLRAVAKKPVAEVDDATLILADQAEMAIEQLKEVVSELLCERLEPDDCRRLAEKLSEGRWTHDYPISASHAAELGLPVSSEMPDAVMKLMEFYPQASRSQSSVEYISQPKSPKEDDADS